MRVVLFCSLLGIGMLLLGPAQGQIPISPVSAESLNAMNRKLGELTGINEEVLKMIEDKLNNDPEFRKKVMEYKGVQEKLSGSQKGNSDSPFSPPEGKFPFSPPTPPNERTAPQPPDQPQEIRPGERVQPPFPPPAPPRPPGEGPNIPGFPSSKGPEFPQFPPMPGIMPDDLNLDQNRVPNNPMLNTFLRHWERNIGPIDQTPELKKALVDFFQNNPELKSEQFRNSELWKELQKSPEIASFGEWLKESTKDTNWKFPDLKMSMNSGSPSSWNWGSGWRWNSPFSGGRSAASGWAMGEVGWLPVVLITLAILAFVLWKFGPRWRWAKNERVYNPLAFSSGGWPVDPRSVSSREQLIQAFEYISVQLCGSSAKVWNHFTIATALRQMPTGEMVADDLAKLYELARYSPPADPLTESDFQLARKCLCELAEKSQG